MMTIAFDLHALFSFLAITVVGDDEYSYECNGHGFCMTFAEALALGITDVADAELHSDLSYAYYDGFKDVHGVKASWVSYSQCTIDELDSMLNDLYMDAMDEEEREAEYERQWEAKKSEQESQFKAASNVMAQAFAKAA